VGAVGGSGQIGPLLEGIAQSANALGSPAAPVTLEYFGDLQCPFCREFSIELLPPIIQRWVRSGSVRVEYHALETATREPQVFIAQQVAALAAGRQGRAWQFIETFYLEQGEEGSGYVTDEFLEAIAGQIGGLDLAKWRTDREDPQLAGEIAADEQAAQASGLSGTPSFLIGRSKGAMTAFSPSDPGSFDTAIEGLLADQ
jgi:protein-disulfide isomerase